MEKIYQKTIGRHLVQPISLFVSHQKSGGIALGISVLIALILANSPISEDYFHFFENTFGFNINGETYFDFTLHHWINDGLMSIFFFVVGLELKHEFISGELSNPRNTILPIGAALGGMLVPAILYLAFNHGTPAAGGWGIPMATDIAFALAVLYVLGNRVPAAAKVFLTTLAVADDLGAVVVIALFYTSNIYFWSLGTGVLLLSIMFVANKMGVKNMLFYGLVGIGGVWTMFLLSGVHATIAAVLAAFMIPADAAIDEPTFLQKLCNLASKFRDAKSNDVRTLEDDQLHLLQEIQVVSKRAVPPSQWLEHYLAPIVTFIIMPIFALANAGISFQGVDFGHLFGSPVLWGIFAGLMGGKVLGIMGATFLLTKAKLATIPESLTTRQLLGLSFLASIGFTMSIFISTLAFQQPDLLMEAKVGIFMASLVGGVVGFFLLKK